MSFLDQFSAYSFSEEELKVKKTSITPCPVSARELDSKFIHLKSRIINGGKDWCIYYIFFAATHKIYVGSTTTWPTRASAHRGRLKSNNHVNKHLQRAFNKYGDKGLYFGVIEEIDERLGHNHLLEREGFWITTLRSWDHNYGYNIHATPLARGSNHMRRKQFSLYSPSGELIVIDDLPQFCNDKNLDRFTMYKVINGHRIEYLGWTRDKERMSEVKKAYTFRSPDGLIYNGIGIRRFCIENNLSYGGMRKVLYGTLHNHKGWTCPSTVVDHKDNRSKSYLLTNVNGEEILIKNLKKWCDQFFDQNAYQKLQKGRIAGGWTIKERRE